MPSEVINLKYIITHAIDDLMYKVYIATRGLRMRVRVELALT